MPDTALPLGEQLLNSLRQMAEGESDPSTLFELANHWGRAVFLKTLRDLAVSCVGTDQVLANAMMIRVQPSSRDKKQAVANLGKLLQHETPDVRWLATYFVFDTGVATRTMVSALDRVMTEFPIDDNRRLWAAGAIYHAMNLNEFGEVQSRALNALLSGLRSENAYDVLISSMGLEKAEVKHNETRAALLRVFPAADRTLQIGILGKLHVFGSVASDSIALMIEHAVSATNPVSLRLAAVTGLARMSRDAKEIDEVLFRLLESSEWQLVQAAASVLSLRHGDSLPIPVIHRLLQYLTHENRDFRGVAAASMADACHEHQKIVEALLDSLDHEDDPDVQDMIIQQLVTRRSETMVLIPDRLPRVSLVRVPVYQYVLLGIAQRQPEMVANLLCTAEVRNRQAAAWVLHSLGPAADRALDALLPLLESPDQDIIRDSLIAFGRIGPSAVRAVPQLARLLVSEHGDISDWAEEALISIGFSAIPALQLAQNKASRSEKSEFDRVLQRLSYAAAGSQVTNLDDTNVEKVVDVLSGQIDRSDVELYYHVGRLLVAHGALSFQRLHTELQSLKAVGLVRQGLACGASTIRLTIAKLERIWSEESDGTVQLIDRGKNAKGGLTVRGVAFLQRVADFLGLPMPV
jgi:hypothetical protein